MKTSLFENKRTAFMSLFLCCSFVSGYPLSANAIPNDVSVHEVAQNNPSLKRTLLGTVVDASSGEPLIGVNIMIKGTTQGTISDLDGKFSIEVTSKSQLEVSYIGYKKQTLSVGDLGVMTIKMQSDNKMMDEVVVIGAGTQKKVSLTGSITTVKGGILKSPSSSLTSSLAGKLSGIVSMTTSGEPGSTSEFYIRGINTFGGRSTPLILLDGVEITSSELNRIPAESIESFSLLKDASATAIYGNRGANGVMLVTTKKGMENTKAKINVSVEGSYFTPVNRVEFADGPTFMRTYNEAEAARSLTGITTPRYSSEQIRYTEEGINQYVYPNVDWYDLLFKSGNYNQRANINLQGGGSRVTYYMALQANHDTGLINAPKNYIYDNNINNWEYNFQNNISYKVTNTTTIDLRLMAQIGNRKGTGSSTSDIYKSVIQANPVAFPATLPREEGDDQIIRFGSTSFGSGAMAQNPYQNMLSTYKEENYNTLNTSLNLTQDLGFLTEGLSLKALVNFNNKAVTWYQHSISPYFYKVKDGSWSKDAPDVFESELLKNGSPYLNQGSINRATNQTFYFDARLDWKRTFNNHNVSAMLMYMMREYRDDILPHRNQGYSGRFTYDYANKYLLEFNFGYNGSERLAKEDRFEFFPAVSLGWVVSSEKFWEPISKYIDHLKVRTSYGLVGSDDFNSNAPRFLYQSEVVIGDEQNFWTGVPGSETFNRGPAFRKFAVANAGWEHVKKFNIGFDMSLFNQLSITFDFFHDYRNRILMARSSWPLMLGYWGATPWSNIGEVVNQGVELSINWSKQLNKDWAIDFRGNLTYNQNEYKYVDEPDYPYVWQTKTGKPLNTLTGYVAEGLFTSEEEIAHWADQSQLGSNVMPGDIKYRDINGDGKLTSEDQVMLSPYNNIPRIQYGLGLNVTYKNLDFGVFFNGSAKRKIMINSGMTPFLSNGGDGVDGPTVERNLMKWIADEHWSVDNPNPNATYPRLGTTSNDVANNIVPSSYWVRNGNFIRFKTLEVGYRFPYCRVYFNGDNLAVFSPFKLWDPELSWNSYPLQRTFNLGVQFTF